MSTKRRYLVVWSGAVSESENISSISSCEQGREKKCMGCALWKQTLGQSLGHKMFIRESTLIF